MSNLNITVPINLKRSFSLKDIYVDKLYQDVHRCKAQILRHNHNVVKKTNYYCHKILSIMTNNKQIIKYDFLIAQNYRQQMQQHKQFPLIVLLPPLSAQGLKNTLIVKYLASRYAKMGYSILIAKSDTQWGGYEECHFNKFTNFFIRNTTYTRLALRHIINHYPVDPEKISATGISFGAIRLSYLLAAEDKIKSSTLVMGGGNLPQILANSRQPDVVRCRKKHMKNDGYSFLEDYEKAVSMNNHLDPLDVAPLIGKDRVKMVITHKDTYVPTRNQIELWQKLGRPEKISLEGGHYYGAYWFFKDGLQLEET